MASPADLVKVRMQADGRLLRQGLQPRYSSSIDALSKIINNEGIGGLWKGVFPNIQRAFLVNMGELACYDHAKRFVIQKQIADDNIYAHTLASIMSGLSATTLSCPHDVVKKRMMSQVVASKGGETVAFRNSYDCLVKTAKLEGVGALWKGFFPTWARLGPWQFVFWVSYERFRQLAGRILKQAQGNKLLAMALRAVFHRSNGRDIASLFGFTRSAHALALPAPGNQAIDSPTAPLLSLPEQGFSSESSIGFQFGSGSMELMAVPKKKTSPHKRGIRNGPKALKPIPVIIRCMNCGKVKLPHFYCCGGRREGTVDK